MKRRPRDDYYVLMWNFVEPIFTGGEEKARLAIERFRQLGCNGGTLIATFIDPKNYLETLADFGLPTPDFKIHDLGTFPFLQTDFPFYVMNVCRALYWSWKEAKPVFRQQYRRFAEEGDRRVFVRVPCLNNPTVRQAIRRRTERIMDGLKEIRHLTLLYDLRDEPSATSFLLASDLCFCEHCLQRMRDWLRERYGSLSALNAEWDADFADWSEVEPLTTLEALERREAGDFNFAPWADHRDFMNHTFADFCAEQRELIRRHDPEAVVGLAGTQCPSVFGGYDFARLVPAIDWAEAYDFGCSVDLIRSLKSRRDFPILKTDFTGTPGPMMEAMLWTFLFQSGGCSGTIIWNNRTMTDVESDDLPPTETGTQRAEVYAELRSGPARLLQACEEVSSPVALLYSHASINADFITAVPNHWRSVAACESERYPAYECREAWWKLLEDRGLRPVFVTSGQVEAGQLLQKGIKVLILPRALAVSEKEAAELRRFVEAGGTLVADSFPARMDEHCRERLPGPLDDLFGIRRSERTPYAGGAQRASAGLEIKPGSRPRWGEGPIRLRLSLVEEGLEVLPEAAVMGCCEVSDAPVGIDQARQGKGNTPQRRPVELSHRPTLTG